MNLRALSLLRGCLVLLALVGSSVAHAQPARSREFDRLVRSAARHYERNEGAEAVSELERAYAIRPAPLLLYNLGRAHELLSHWDAAVDYYQRFLASGPDERAAAVGQEALASARRRLEQQRQEQAQREATTRAELLAREQAEREARERQARAMVGITRPAAGRRVTSAVTTGLVLGGTGLVLGGVFGALTLDAAMRFPTQRSGAERADLQDRSAAFGWTAGAGFVLLGVGGLTALLGYVLQPARAPEPVATGTEAATP